MLNMTTYKFGDVVLAPFPFTDQTTSKKRPAVVISSELYHLEHGDVMIMAVTSSISLQKRSGEVMLQDWQAAGLI
jgi:mRNA interferase MazF